MNPVDKAAIAWSIGIVAVFVALAAAGGSLHGAPADAPIDPNGLYPETGRNPPADAPGPEPVAGAPAGMPGPAAAVTVYIQPDTEVPGCELTDECYVPSAANVTLGGTVTWTNDDDSAHTATAGTPRTGPTLEFDSSLIQQGASYAVTFEAPGSYRYFCLVHPWMSGVVNVG